MERRHLAVAIGAAYAAHMGFMTYKGYAARVSYDPSLDQFVGQIVGVNDKVAFSVKALRAALHDKLDDYLATCAQTGISPTLARSGQLRVRISPEIHARAAHAARAAGMTFPAWFEDTLRRATAFL